MEMEMRIDFAVVAIFLAVSRFDLVTHVSESPRDSDTVECRVQDQVHPLEHQA
jgi:hypothetical protein